MFLFGFCWVRVNPKFAFEDISLVCLGAGRRLPNMSLRIFDLGRTSRMLMRSETLIVPSSSCSIGYSDMALERALIAVLWHAVDASLPLFDL